MKNVAFPMVSFTHFANVNQLPDFFISGKLAANGVNSKLLESRLN